MSDANQTGKIGQEDQVNTSSEVAGERFPPRLRLKNGAQFQSVYRKRCSVADGMLIVYAAKNELPLSRLGLSVSRKVGNAVVRNRWKRIIRDVFRRHRTQLPTGFDFVVLPFKGAEPSSASIESSLPRLAAKAVKKIDSKSKTAKPKSRK